MLQPCSHDPFHCGLVSFLFSAVCPTPTLIVNNAVACGRLFHVCVQFFCTMISFIMSVVRQPYVLVVRLMLCIGPVIQVLDLHASISDKASKIPSISTIKYRSTYLEM
ncbi:hypothetical protein EDB19DRAFT_1735660 [Suillus lakei]|nr:hypothetical protein EDB19DRAFT_1735660 [Suillus lakei]